MTQTRLLDISCESPAILQVRQELCRRIVGQEEAVTALVDIAAKISSGLYDRNRPIATMLLLGPTGSGKTSLTEAFTEVLYGDIRHRIKIDCAEFQHSGDIAKLVGSPPGYLGHRETPPMFTNSRIEGLYTEERPYALLVLDEIEKASDALWHLLLGILDKGKVTNGYNEEVDLTRTIVLMTSNAGSSEMAYALGHGMGFRSGWDHKGGGILHTAEPNAKRIADIGVAAAKRKFTPEFINRLDRVIACNALTQSETTRIIDLELNLIQETLFKHCDPVLLFTTSPAARAAILAEGFDPKYNARNIKRVLDKRIQNPLGCIIANNLCLKNESVHIDFVESTFTFIAVSS